MAVTTTNIQNVAVGTGAVTAFPFTFRYTAASQIVVYRTVGVADPVIVSTFDYSITPGTGYLGGTVTFTTAPALDDVITIERVMPLTQTTTITNQDGFFPTVVTDALDRLTMADQQINADVTALDASVDARILAAINEPLGPSNSYLAPFTGAVARTETAKLSDTVSVKDFGAVGDGITNDAAAIILAVASGRRVLFPAGIYLISFPLTFTSKTDFALEGDGASVTTIKLGAGSFASSPVTFTTCARFSVTGITFDQSKNASLTTNTLPLVIAISSTDVEFRNCRFVEHTYIALCLNSCQRFRVEGNYGYRDALANTLNYNLNISSSISASGPGFISGNHFVNSGMIAVGVDIHITGNFCEGFGYGAAISTIGQTGATFYGRYLVDGNECSGGVGRDSDGFMVCGMEIAGTYSVISNNHVHTNAGEGIRVFAYQSIVSGNIVYNNGNGGDGTFTQGAIVPCYSTATYSGSYSLITGNICFDTGVGSQLYGYAEQSSSLVGMTVRDNKLAQNVTGPVLLAGGVNIYEFETAIAYTPTIAASVGTITAGACGGRYLRRGKLVFFTATCNITANGTGSATIVITLPLAAAAGIETVVVYGRGLLVSGALLQGIITAGASTVTVITYAGLYPGATGEAIAVSGSYLIA